TQASCARRPASPCCGARRWVRCRSVTRSRCASRTATGSSACSSPSADSSDGRPRMTMPSFAASELASRFGLELRGEDVQVHGVATLAEAGPGQLGFLANPRYRGQLAASRAGVVVLRDADAGVRDGSMLVARDPYPAFARIAALFERVPARQPGIHPSAVVDPSARVDPGAHVGPLASIGAR